MIQPKFMADFLLNDFRGILKKMGKTITTCGISPYEMMILVTCIEQGLMTRKTVREILTELIKNDSLKSPN